MMISFKNRAILLAGVLSVMPVHNVMAMTGISLDNQNKVASDYTLVAVDEQNKLAQDFIQNIGVPFK